MSCLYLNSSKDSSIRFFINSTWNGNIPTALPVAPAVSPAGSPDKVRPVAPLGKVSVLCFTLSNIKLCAGDTEIHRIIYNQMKMIP